MGGLCRPIHQEYESSFLLLIDISIRIKEATVYRGVLIVHP